MPTDRNNCLEKPNQGERLLNCPLAEYPAPDTTEALLALLAEPPHGKWLDLGCGAAKTVELLRALGCDAAGVDISAPDNAGCIIKADMRELPFDNALFEGCVAECSLSVCGDAASALVEAARVLKPGGTLLVSDVCFKCADAPALSLGEGATLARWRALLDGAGFEILSQADASGAWRGYIARLIWDGEEPEELFGCARGVKGAGYVLIRAVKKTVRGVEDAAPCQS